MSNLSKKTKGEIAELSVAKNLIQDGYKVSFPYVENNRYDLVAEKENKFIRVQVKYATPKEGVLEINCRSSNNWSVLHYSSRDIDLIAAYNPHTEKVYFIPVDQINHSLIRLRIEPSKNNQKSGVHFAEDFARLKI